MSEPDPNPTVVAARCLPPFRTWRLRLQILIDDALWWTLKLGLVLMIVIALFESARHRDHPNTMVPLFALLVVAWVFFSIVSARVAKQIPHLGELIDQGSPDAEQLLARLVRRTPLQRSVRLLIYHRMAMLLHRRRQFRESSALCRAMLNVNLGPVQEIRAHLLLMLGEAAMHCHDMWSTWHALVGLHQCRLNLNEMLQLVALQTRYEVEVGHDGAALWRLDQKVAMAELLPNPQNGIMHALLARACRRRKQDATADRLQRKAELLCTNEQLHQVGLHHRASAG